MKRISSLSADADNKGKLRPRLTRVSDDSRPGFRWTERADAMLIATYGYRAMEPQMYEQLFFPAGPVINGKRKTHSNCQRYLRELSGRGFLLETAQPPTFTTISRPLVYWLNQQGAEKVAELLGVEMPQLDWKPGKPRVGPMHIDHLLDTNWVRIAIVLASRALGWTVAEWRDDLTLKREHALDEANLKTPQGKKRQRLVPDSYGVLTHVVSEEEEDVMRFFLEVDRSTTTGVSASGHPDLATKVLLYREFLRPGGLAEKHYGTNAGRILFVMLGKKRLANLKQIIESHGGRRRYWLTTLEQVKAENILSAPIWQVASADGFYSLLDA